MIVDLVSGHVQYTFEENVKNLILLAVFDIYTKRQIVVKFY